MTQKIYLHIGFPKTATTYFQTNVFPNLKDFLYIGRPYTQENTAFNMLQYADESLYDEKVVEQEFDKIKSIANNRSIIISDELFIGVSNFNFINRGRIIKRFKALLPNAEIILFIRNQPDLVYSLYGQYLKIGWYDKPIDEHFFYQPGAGFSLQNWLDGDRSWNIQRRYFNHRGMLSTTSFKYSHLIDSYKKYFPKVHVFLYEAFKQNPDFIYKKLFTILDTKPSIKIPQKEIINKSLNKDKLHQKMWSNRLNQGLGLPFRNFIANSIAAIRPNLNEQNKAFILKQLRESQTFEDNILINQKYQLGMEQYANKYFNK